MNNQVLPRPLSERREAAVEHLRSHSNLWLATASDGRGPHLIPMSYWWDGSRLTTATLEDSRTLKNLRAQPKVRAAVGSTGDVLMIDETAAIVDIADMDTAAGDGYARVGERPAIGVWLRVHSAHPGADAGVEGGRGVPGPHGHARRNVA